MIYFIQDSRRLLIKIGYTGKPDVQARLRAAKTWVTSRLAVLHLEESGSRADEARLHQQLKSARYVGEWFRPTTEVIGCLMGLCGKRAIATPVAEVPRSVTLRYPSAYSGRERYNTVTSYDQPLVAAIRELNQLVNPANN